MFLIFDTETTGLPKNWDAPLTDFENWPRLVQLAWQTHDEMGVLVDVKNFIIKPEGFVIPRGSEKIHGISTERALAEGQPLSFVLDEFNKELQKADTIVGHNVEFDNIVVGVEMLRLAKKTPLLDLNIVDTKEVSTEFCALPGGRGGNFKWPTLGELHEKLFGDTFDAAHNASADVQATARCFLELLRIGIITSEHLKIDEKIVLAFRDHHPHVIESIGLEVAPYHEISEKEDAVVAAIPKEVMELLVPESFAHLHVHTQYSVLDGLSDIGQMLQKAKKDGMTAVAITDHGNMFGAKKFHEVCLREGIKPILGCEIYVARRGIHRKESKIDASGHHLVLLAKNLKGYHNLIKLISIAWIDGQYYKPRVDKDLLREYHEGIIALSACLGGEVASNIIDEGAAKGEEAVIEYKEIFGEDFYLELQRHPTGDPEMDQKVYDDQVYVNRILLEFAQKHQIKVVATNDVHFVEAEEAGAHDRLICIGTAKDLDDPKRLRYTQQEWFKTQQEMKALFHDIPEAITNTKEVVDKIETYKLNSDPIMPEFVIPEAFGDANEYLRHITYEGATKRYAEVTDEIRERLDFELETIRKMGFPDYFLIVWDFLTAAREMGVSIGPGRGSAAGSVVSYCLKITDIDPLAYNLLFERFLNPDRISMPDIDIDFDDDGRDKVLRWVSDKYGKRRVAHLITFGTMAAKMAIRDVARVQQLPLSEADRLAKMIPERPGVSLSQALKEVPEFMKELKEGKAEVAATIQNALTLEGSIRNTGTHACGIIIGREDLDNYVPLAAVKESVLDISTQYDGKFIESIGLLKMDFLGLKTLSIIKDTLVNIKRSKGEVIDMDSIPFDDKETYELYSRGETTALFQFESDGMQKHLKELKPSRFEDLIAMNALYRPGPMDYIPNFIDRKHGREAITYDLPIMEEILKETYGITVYQEQVMLLSRLMAGFTRGQSDSLRKAMGKKKIAEMEKLKVKFVEGCEKNGLEKEKVLKVWKDWEAFANYAFNKSHATCYSYLSYQTAYLKTHYPAEFMAANLSRNLHDIKKITQLTKESGRMGIEVMRPDVNESAHNFTVTKDGMIRFGMAAIKGVGEAAVEQLVREREENGPFTNIFDFAKRVSLKSVNKRSFEALAYAGAFDGFPNTHRAQYFYVDGDSGTSFIEKVIKHGSSFQERQNSQQASLFGNMEEAFEVLDPDMPICEPWDMVQKLRFEREVTGFYISGHPLDDYYITIDRYCNIEAARLKNDLAPIKGQNLMFAGMITEVSQKMSKKGSPYGRFTIEDYTGSISLMMFSEEYLKRKHLLEVGNSIFIQAKVEERFHQPGSYNIQIVEMFLLAEALGKMAKSITLSVGMDKVNQALTDKILILAKEHHGPCTIRIRLSDPENGSVLVLKSTSAKADPHSFLKEIRKMRGIQYSIE